MLDVIQYLKYPVNKFRNFSVALSTLFWTKNLGRVVAEPENMILECNVEQRNGNRLYR